MKKIILSVFLFMMFVFVPNANAGEETFFGIGAELFKEPFNNKVLVTNVFPDSPAQRAGLSIGDEIVSVDNEKVKKMCICEVTSRIRGDKDTAVKLVIKKHWWKWETIEITRDTINAKYPDENPELEKYWKQISPECFNCTRCFADEVVKKLSLKYKRKVLPVVNYWFERKQGFTEGFNTCKSYSKNNQETCLINFMNRQNLITVEDKKLFEVLRQPLK